MYSFAAMALSSMIDRPVLVAPAAFGADLRASQVAAAIGRGLEAAGLRPPDLCPLSGGGDGTIEVLLPALGGETADGFALIEAGATALVEPAREPAGTAARLRAAAAAGPAVVVLAAADAGPPHAAQALTQAGPLGGPRVVVLTGPGSRDDRPALGAGVLAEPGARFVLEALGVGARLRAARAVVVGTGRLDERALEGAVEGELAVDARQAGVPCHAVVGERALDLFATRILDIQRIVEAPTLAAVEAAGAALAEVL
ncbi:MAG: glycerate 2-kinase [Solirubrobacteraceae bacterium]|nr:glycerate 2-kinase [Solirubrobacteraceae bacterium]